MSEEIGKRVEAHIKKLNSGNKKVILETLTSLRKIGKTAEIPYIIALLQSNDEQIKKEANSFLNDLNEQEVAPLIIDAIKDKKYKNEKNILLSACWQSDLNFTEYAEDFVNIVIHDDYLTAFEAFTVLENMAPEINIAVLKKLIIKIQNVLKNIEKDKETLLLELIKVLS